MHQFLEYSLENGNFINSKYIEKNFKSMKFGYIQCHTMQINTGTKTSIKKFEISENTCVNKLKLRFKVQIFILIFAYEKVHA